MTGEKNKNQETTEKQEATKRGRIRKGKQVKVGVTEKGNVHLNEFMEKANKSARRRVNVPDVMEYLILKLSDKDVPKVQERAYTPDDKMEIMREEYNLRNPDNPMTKEAMKAVMAEMFDKQVLGKLSKKTNGEHQDSFELKTTLST